MGCLLPIAFQSETQTEATGVWMYMHICILSYVYVCERCLLPIAYESETHKEDTVVWMHFCCMCVYVVCACV